MAYKERTVPVILQILRVLNRRMELNAEEVKYYLNKEKGYEGELQFDSLTDKSLNTCYILNDVELEFNNSSFQLDTVVVQNAIYYFEIKSFEGDYCYALEKFTTVKGKEIANPMNQLRRNSTLLRQLLQHHGFHLTVEAFVVFINHEFTLYDAPRDLPFIYPTQINRFLSNMNTKPTKLNQTHKKIADLLVSLQKTEELSVYTKVPKYDYLGLRKGITCRDCGSFFVRVGSMLIVVNVVVVNWSRRL